MLGVALLILLLGTAAASPERSAANCTQRGSTGVLRREQRYVFDGASVMIWPTWSNHVPTKAVKRSPKTAPRRSAALTAIKDPASMTYLPVHIGEAPTKAATTKGGYVSLKGFAKTSLTHGAQAAALLLAAEVLWSLRTTALPASSLPSKAKAPATPVPAPVPRALRSQRTRMLHILAGAAAAVMALALGTAVRRSRRQKALAHVKLTTQPRLPSTRGACAVETPELTSTASAESKAAVHVKLTAQPSAEETPEVTRTPSAESKASSSSSNTQHSEGRGTESSSKSLPFRLNPLEQTSLPHFVQVDPDLTGFGRPGYVELRRREIEQRQDEPQVAHERGRAPQRAAVRLTPSHSPERVPEDEEGELPLRTSYHRLGSEMDESEDDETRQAMLQEDFCPEPPRRSVPESK